MDHSFKELAGLLVAGFLAADGLLHLYWFAGGVFPARDPKALSLAVLNTEISFTTPVVLGLATALLLGSVTVLARVLHFGLVDQLIPGAVLQVGVLVIVAGLLLRGLAGCVWALGLFPSRSHSFYTLNLLVYTPLCLLLFVAALLAVLA